MLALGSLLFALFCIEPLPLVTLGLAAPFLCALFWLGISCYQQGPPAMGLTLNVDGQLRWWQSALPAGQLMVGSLVSEYGLLLRWHDADNRQYQQWLLYDQLTIADYRALARQLNQVNWQGQSNSNHGNS
ncbi:hypothetical protein WG68_15310 [Arsukibacterium ikkense]|uniref:Uncharacterized protein n=1 Tax=Arsukibacterium ikkense TaxID=336831 RepID=A0A0M2V4E6_9GAMM|nr:hypothetical protein WG68_15310 [Arsukibacterium ikkense]